MKNEIAVIIVVNGDNITIDKSEDGVRVGNVCVTIINDDTGDKHSDAIKDDKMPADNCKSNITSYMRRLIDLYNNDGVMANELGTEIKLTYDNTITTIDKLAKDTGLPRSMILAHCENKIMPKLIKIADGQYEYSEKDKYMVKHMAFKGYCEQGISERLNIPISDVRRIRNNENPCKPSPYVVPRPYVDRYHLWKPEEIERAKQLWDSGKYKTISELWEKGNFGGSKGRLYDIIKIHRGDEKKNKYRWTPEEIERAKQLWDSGKYKSVRELRRAGKFEGSKGKLYDIIRKHVGLIKKDIHRWTPEEIERAKQLWDSGKYKSITKLWKAGKFEGSKGRLYDIIRTHKGDTYNKQYKWSKEEIAKAKAEWESGKYRSLYQVWKRMGMRGSSTTFYKIFNGEK
jgi:hypothetical protein